jgi:hypothetical protein
MDEKPVSPAAPARLASRISLGIAIACALLAVPFVLFSRDVMIQTYTGFKMEQGLPGLTQLALHPLALWLFPALALIGLVKEVLFARRDTLRMNVALCIVVFLSVVLYATTLMLPFYALLRHLE